jgi:hypothetical protein
MSSSSPESDDDGSWSGITEIEWVFSLVKSLMGRAARCLNLVEGVPGLIRNGVPDNDRALVFSFKFLKYKIMTKDCVALIRWWSDMGENLFTERKVAT